MIPTKNEVKKALKLVAKNRNEKKEDWYDGLSFEQVSVLYEHARCGYFTKSMTRFVYPDAQSNLFYMRIQLLLKYLSEIKKLHSIEKARSVYLNLQCCGWLEFTTLHGEDVICKGESISHIKKLENGILPENAKSIWD